MTEKTPENQPAINKSLGLPDMWKTIDEPLSVNVTDTTHVDVEYIRKNLRGIIESGTTSMNEIMSLAATMESPRAYEVVAVLLKAVLDANRELMETVQLQRKEEKENPSQQTRTVNNNLFVGSTQELQKMLHEIIKK